MSRLNFRIIVFLTSLCTLILIPEINGRGQESSVSNQTNIKLEILPKNVEKQPRGDSAVVRLSNRIYLSVVAKNNSDIPIKAYLVDRFYQNRPELFKNGRVVEYRSETAKLIRSKDSDPEFVRTGSIVSLEPHTSTVLDEIDLTDWYGDLKPGIYKITNRYRLNVEAAWTPPSEELQFEVIQP